MMVRLRNVILLVSFFACVASQNCLDGLDNCYATYDEHLEHGSPDVADDFRNCVNILDCQSSAEKEKQQNALNYIEDVAGHHGTHGGASTPKPEDESESCYEALSRCNRDYPERNDLQTAHGFKNCVENVHNCNDADEKSKREDYLLSINKEIDDMQMTHGDRSDDHHDTEAGESCSEGMERCLYEYNRETHDERSVRNYYMCVNNLWCVENEKYAQEEILRKLQPILEMYSEQEYHADSGTALQSTVILPGLALLMALFAAGWRCHQ